MFNQDKARGDIGETIVKEKLERKGFVVSVMKGHFKDYDMVVYKSGINPIPVEVKTDYRFAETNNIAFEKQALEHSKTNIWFYVLDPEEKKEVHMIDRTKALQVAPRFRQGDYGEHKETVFLIDYSSFLKELKVF